MKNIVFALLALTSSLVFAKDFSSFEQSLFDKPAAEKNSEDSTESRDSTESTAVESNNSLDEFEKSLMTSPTELEPIYVCRDQILEAVQKKDSKKVAELVNQLKGLESRRVASYLPFELETIYTEMNMLDQLTDHYVDHYRTLLDTGKYDSDVHTIKDDPLYLHVVKFWKSQDTTKAPYELVVAKINNSRLPDVKRRKLEILSMLRFAYMDEIVGQDVRALTEAFVEKYPDDPDAPWMKHTILGPLSRMSIWDLKMLKRSENKEKVIENKLYTGGFGFNLYLAMGGFGIGYEDVYRNDIYEPDPVPVNWEFYIQFGRFTALLELVNSGVSGISSFGWGLGWVVYDSRYLKVRPYFGAETSYMNYRYKDNYVVGGTSLSPAGNSESSGLDEEGFRGILGVNVDFKFITAYFLASSSKLSSLSVVGKFGVSSMDIDTNVAKGEGYEAFFALGLGIYLW